MKRKIKQYLKVYFDSGEILKKSLPAVSSLAEQFNISPKYFSDMLKNQTGETATSIFILNRWTKPGSFWHLPIYL